MCIYTSNHRKRRQDRPNLDLWGTGFCAAFNSRRTARAITSLYDCILQDSGIRSTQFAIMVGIAKLKRATMGQLADVLLLDHTTITRSLRLMQNQGLLSISNRSVRRQRFVRLLSKGQRKLAYSLTRWRNIQDKFVNEIGGMKHWVALQQEFERLAVIAGKLETKNSAMAAGFRRGSRQRKL